MRAVYRKELRQYFHSVIGYLFLAIFLFISGYFFVLQNLMNRSGDISTYFQNVISYMMFLMPLLTMRSFAEEKKQRTDQLLLTMPLRPAEVVLGKFFAGFTVLAIGMAVTVAFPVILAIYGSLEIWVTLGNYLAMMLLLGCFLSIGLLVSALTENQIVAAVGTYVILFTLWFSSGFSSSIQNQQLLSVLSRISLMEKFYEMSLGVFNPASILLYIILTGLFLFFTVMVLDNRLKELWAYCLLVVLAAVSVSTVVTEAVNRFGWKADMTTAGLFEITDTTREIVADLDEEVEIIYLNSETSADDYVVQVLDRYEVLSRLITVEYVNITENPSFAAEYTAKGTTISEDGVIVKSAESEVVLEWSDLYEFSGSSSTGYTVTGFQAEKQITSAIAQVTSVEEKEAVLIQGHSENYSSALESLIGTGGYTVSELVLGMEDIPDSVGTVVIAGPTKDYSEAEIDKLDAFMGRGGTLLVFRGAGDGELPVLDAFLTEWGVTLNSTAVMDSSQQIDSPLNLVPSFASHLINVFFSENQTYLSIPSCRSLTINSSAGKSTIAVLNSSNTSYERAIEEGIDDTTQLDTDTAGPFVLAATSENTVTVDGEEETAHLFVCGSSSFYTDELLSTTSVGNANFILEVLAWCNDDSVVVNVPSKNLITEQISITYSSVVTLAVIFLGVIPGILLLGGLAVFFRRRHL